MSKVLVNESSLTGIADAIRGKNGTSDVYMPSEMALAITNLPTGAADPVLNDLAVNANGIYNPPDGVDGFSMVTVNVPTGGGDIEVEPIYLSVVQSYGCAGPIASQYIELFGDTITTGNITFADNMFAKYSNSYVPFDINFNSSSKSNLYRMFVESKVKELPAMNYCYPQNMQEFCKDANYLLKIPEGFGDNWNWDYLHQQTYQGLGSVFDYCFVLRSIPESFLNELYCCAIYNTYTYNCMFRKCMALDCIKGLGVARGTLTNNCFTNTFNNCGRINEMTFAKQADGTCFVENWKNQIIDLTQAGYISYDLSYLEAYGSDISMDKEVYDLDTYASFSSDPDWFSTTVEWARYNGYCALQTVQTLPDCSSSGGTNTIKFADAGGSSIVDETMSEIFAQNEAAVAEATAKGWTISFV